MSEPKYGMSTDGPTPAPCDEEIFQKGKTVVVVYGSSNAIERYVQSIAKKANARVDWHFSGGRANVLHLGDADSRARVESALDELPPQPPVEILYRVADNEPGLYRATVTPAPDNAIAAFDDGGQTAFIISEKENK